MKGMLFCLSLCCLLGVGPLHGHGQQANTPPTAQKPAATSDGSLTGRVVDEEDQPLADVEIRMFGRGAARTTVSDEEGKFSFTSLVEGQYTLNVQAPAYIQPISARTYRTGETVTLKLRKGGVITGRVTNARGEPVVAVSVSAQMIRNPSDAANERASDYSYTQRTDDRGVYRLYGLQPGSYLVVANAPVRAPVQTTAYQYQKELPSYHPSGPRETAQVVDVRAGAEAPGIDIRYINESGHSISGTVAAVPTSANASTGYTTVSLQRAASGEQFAVTNTQPNAAQKGFVFAGVPEGEYELIARSSDGASNGAVSALRRVSVKNADVTGVTLTLLPLGSLAGRVVSINPATPPACPGASALAFDEAVVFVRRAETSATERPEQVEGSGRVNQTGEFIVRGLAAASYHVTLSSRNELWYVQSLRLPASSPATGTALSGSAKPVDIAHTGLALKTGENLTGLTITLAPGAATLLGRVLTEADNPLPKMTRVYAVPAEPNAVDEVLRYAETIAAGPAGRFSFNRLAPGRYRLVVEALPAGELRPAPPGVAALNQAGRARLQRLAAMQPEIELKACARVEGYELRLK